MTDEMKLLQELCKALGFEIETILDRDERKESKSNAREYNSGIRYPAIQGRTLSHTFGAYDIDEDGMYTSYLIKPIISYKLTKISEDNKDE